LNRDISDLLKIYTDRLCEENTNLPVIDLVKSWSKKLTSAGDGAFTAQELLCGRIEMLVMIGDDFGIQALIAFGRDLIKAALEVRLITSLFSGFSCGY
jgi:hypothetical protein